MRLVCTMLYIEILLLIIEQVRIFARVEYPSTPFSPPARLWCIETLYVA